MTSGRTLLARGEHADLPRQGPVVIDWANAARGDAPFDVALTAVVLAGAPVRPPLSWLRDWFVRAFVGEFALIVGGAASIALSLNGEPMAT